VSAELVPSCCSEEPDAAGLAESWSLWKSFAESGGVVPSSFMVSSTEAASKSWTCWCLEISNLEV
jgi:hypothetical protein